MTNQPERKPWSLPEKVSDLKRRSLTDADYAEAALEGVSIGSEDDLAEVLNYLDLLGHRDAATKLADAAHNMKAAIQYAYGVLSDPAPKAQP